LYGITDSFSNLSIQIFSILKNAKNKNRTRMTVHLSEGYEGTDTHRYIDRLLSGRGNSLLIITPFIGPFYARMLLKESKRKDVYIIISHSDINSKAERLLTHRHVGGYVKALAYLAVLAAILYYFRITVFAIGTSAVFAAVLAMMLVSLGKRSRVWLKVASAPFIHEKLYIADAEAITGSANLTFGGTHKNLEQIEVIHDQNEIGRLREHFWSVWNGLP